MKGWRADVAKELDLLALVKGVRANACPAYMPA